MNMRKNIRGMTMPRLSSCKGIRPKAMSDSCELGNEMGYVEVCTL